jgi:hypothetical protein
MDQTRQMRLAQLKGLLNTLPNCFPTSAIDFSALQVDLGEVNGYSYTGAVNRVLNSNLGGRVARVGIGLSH